MKKTSEAVKKSRAKAGVSPTSIALTDAEKAEIDALAEELGMTRKDTILEAVRSFKGQGEISTQRLLQELRRRLK
jgi:hypothetical protein